MKRDRHICRCRDCGAAHVRRELPPARCCAICLEWLPLQSKARYCSDACRRRARQRRADQAASDARDARLEMRR